MDTLQQLKDELTAEYNTTKKYLELFPEGKNDYAPHEKSMKMMPLAQHIVEVFGWPAIMFKTDILDFAEGERPPVFETKQQLQEELETNYATATQALKNTNENELKLNWALAYKGQILAEWTKYGAIRHSLNQITHHRAQLGVYYRLNEIKLPGSYGPSADDATF